MLDLQSRPQDARPDMELVAATQAGDDTAFGVLWRRHEIAAHRLARLVSGNPANVEDLVSEAFTRVLRAIRAGNGPSDTFRPYLLNTLRRINIDNARSYGLRVVLTDDDEDLEPPPEPSAADQTMARDERDTAFRAWASLPPATRTLLWHLVVEGETPAQIAPVLGTTANGVSCRIQRAKEQLREAFLREHLADAADEGCRSTRDALARRARRRILRRESDAVEAHLRECVACQAAADELEDVNRTLRVTLGPLLIGGGGLGARYLRASRGRHPLLRRGIGQARAHTVVTGASVTGAVAGIAAAVVVVAGSTAPHRAAERPPLPSASARVAVPGPPTPAIAASLASRATTGPSPRPSTPGRSAQMGRQLPGRAPGSTTPAAPSGPVAPSTRPMQTPTPTPTSSVPPVLPVTWTQQHPATSPPARNQTVMAYDAAAGSAVLFSGLFHNDTTDPAAQLADTWTWNGSTWTAHGGAAPPARYSASMAYDAANGTVVLFGGYNIATGTYLSDTWIWNGTAWTAYAGASPPGQAGAAMTYDPATGSVILFGGQHGTGAVDTTWSWDGSSWLQLAPPTSPSARYSPSLAYDPARRTLVLFSGYDPATSTTLDDTWTFDGSRWTRQSPPSSPPATFGLSLLCDPVSSAVLLAPDDAAGTWRWTGTTWIRLATVPGPPPRISGGIVYDTNRQQLLLFSGFQVPRNSDVADTWTARLNLPGR